MTGAWFGDRTSRGSRGGPDLSGVQEAIDGAAQALIDLDTRQNYVDGAIKATVEVTGSPDLGRAWAPIADKAFAASAEYLKATSDYPLLDRYGEPNRNLNVDAARRAFIAAHRSMADAASAIDSFYSRNRERVDEGKRALEALPRLEDEARRAATAATDAAARLAEQNPALLDYRTVVTAMDELSAAMAALNRGGKTGDRQQAAAAVQRAATELGQALQDAPQLAGRAASAVTSLRTRLDSLATRIDRLPAAQSAMWREFTASASADLAQHDKLARAALADARAQFERARGLAGDGDPQSTLDAVAAARAKASEVDRLIDEVTGRLDVLRAARSDPHAAERTTRFAIRDAQRLVVDRGLVAEWGSVLDAQSDRVDRAMSTVTAPHPDYWAMLTELDKVKAFVADVVDRVRQTVRG